MYSYRSNVNSYIQLCSVSHIYLDMLEAQQKCPFLEIEKYLRCVKLSNAKKGDK